MQRNICFDQLTIAKKKIFSNNTEKYFTYIHLQYRDLLWWIQNAERSIYWKFAIQNDLQFTKIFIKSICNAKRTFAQFAKQKDYLDQLTQICLSFFINYKKNGQVGKKQKNLTALSMHHTANFLRS